jgi:hypothetical protein
MLARMAQEAISRPGPYLRYPRNAGVPQVSGVPGPCLRERKGGFASLFLAPLPRQTPGTGNKSYEATGILIVVGRKECLTLNSCDQLFVYIHVAFILS